LKSSFNVIQEYIEIPSMRVLPRKAEAFHVWKMFVPSYVFFVDEEVSKGRHGSFNWVTDESKGES